MYDVDVCVCLMCDVCIVVDLSVLFLCLCDLCAHTHDDVIIRTSKRVV